MVPVKMDAVNNIIALTKDHSERGRAYGTQEKIQGSWRFILKETCRWHNPGKEESFPRNGYTVDKVGQAKENRQDNDWRMPNSGYSGVMCSNFDRYIFLINKL